MKKTDLAKNLKLSLEFNTYLTKHPKMYDKIPNGSCLVFTIKGDPLFNKEAITNTKTRKPLLEVQKSKSNWIIRPIQKSS